MAGTTGKRARPAGRCYRCNRDIRDATFERDRKGDSHSMNADGTYPCVKAIERAAHLYESFEPSAANRICDQEGIGLEDGARGAQLAEQRKNDRAIDRQFYGAPEYGGRR
jgi:hypothetical protein